MTSIASTVLKISVISSSTDSDSGQQDSSNHPKEGKPTRIKEGNHNAHHVQLEKNSWTPVLKMSQIFAFLAQDRVIRKTRLCIVLLILGKIALELSPSLVKLLSV